MSMEDKKLDAKSAEEQVSVSMEIISISAKNVEAVQVSVFIKRISINAKSAVLYVTMEGGSINAKSVFQWVVPKLLLCLLLYIVPSN